MLQLSNIDFRYRADLPWVFQQLSIELPEQGIIGLLGHNGAGKSTLLSIIAGLYQPQQGTLAVGAPAQKVDSQQLLNRVSLVPQDFAFYQELTVRQNLDLFYKIATQHQQAVAMQQVIADCQLEALLNKYVYRLSGGQKRRLNLAIGLLKQADILLLDEPTVGIDPESKVLLLNSIRQIADQGKCVVFTSHILNEVETLVDQICILHHGALKLAPTDLSQLHGNQQVALQLKQLEHKPQLTPIIQQYDCQWLKPDFCLVSGLNFSGYATLVAKLSSEGIDINCTSFGANTLESVYLTLTGAN